MSEFVDRYLRRQVQISRVADAEAAHVSRIVRETNLEIDTRIRSLAPLTGQKVDKLQGTIRRKLETSMARSLNTTDRIISQVAVREVNWNVMMMEEFGPDDFAVSTPEQRELVRSVRRQNYHGRTFPTWFDRLQQTGVQRMNGMLIGTFTSGMSNTEIADSIKPVARRMERDVRTLARSYVQMSASQSRDQMLKQNADIYDELLWVATLDNRTTTICGVRDGKRYTKDTKKPIGHSYPWESGPGSIHFNCRSTAVPKFKGIDVGGTRPSVSAGRSYDRGDKFTRTGRTRKATKPNREKGIYKIKPVPATTNYESWLRTQPTAFVQDALGSVKKAQLFLNGRRLRNFLPATGPGSVGVLTGQSVNNL